LIVFLQNGRFASRPYETMNPRMDCRERPFARRAPRFWIPAFAGMTAKDQPRRPFDLTGNNIETAARISPPPRAAPESRHSGEGRNPGFGL